MLEGRTVRVVEDLEDRFFPKLIGKKLNCLSIELATRSSIKVIHSNVSKKESTVQQENPLKIFSRKIWWNEIKGFIFAPRNLRETAGRKKEENARIERVNNKFLYQRKSDLCKIYMYTRCSTEKIESTVNDTIRKGHL